MGTKREGHEGEITKRGVKSAGLSPKNGTIRRGEVLHERVEGKKKKKDVGGQKATMLSLTRFASPRRWEKRVMHEGIIRRRLG